MIEIFNTIFAFLLGSGLQLCAMGAFAWITARSAKGSKVSETAKAHQVVKSFYLAELVKWLIVLAGFSLIWVFKPDHPLSVLVGFFVPQLVYWNLTIWRAKKRQK